MDKKIITGLVIGAIVIAGGSFYGGMKYADSVRAAARANFANGQFAPNANGGGGARVGRGGGTAGVGFIAGDIIAKDDKSITIKLPNNGGSKIVFLSASTQIVKSAGGSIADLAVGETVSANGSVNSEGSINAQSIQIRPKMPENNN